MFSKQKILSATVKTALKFYFRTLSKEKLNHPSIIFWVFLTLAVLANSYHRRVDAIDSKFHPFYFGCLYRNGRLPKPPPLSWRVAFFFYTLMFEALMRKSFKPLNKNKTCSARLFGAFVQHKGQ
ncbi:MAG: hypothetical protein ACI9SP_002747 [Arenicella sp.]